MTISMWFRWDYSLASGSWGYTSPFLMYSDDSSSNALIPRFYWSGSSYNSLYWYGYADGSYNWIGFSDALDNAVAGEWTHLVITIESNFDFVRDMPSGSDAQAEFSNTGGNFLNRMYVDTVLVLLN